jgi:hypothetical protein
MAAGVAAGEDGCESAGCCAAALNEASKQVVNIQFQVRMTLFSKFFSAKSLSSSVPLTLTPKFNAAKQNSSPVHRSGLLAHQYAI